MPECLENYKGSIMDTGRLNSEKEEEGGSCSEYERLRFPNNLTEPSAG